MVMIFEKQHAIDFIYKSKLNKGVALYKKKCNDVYVEFKFDLEKLESYADIAAVKYEIDKQEKDE